MARQPYLDAVAQRVIVFDGAFGTYVQGLDLSADDFGGPELEGCNEMLCLTRPDVIRSMHDAFFAVGVDAVETASFGSFGVVLNEYSIAEKTHALNVAAAQLAREVADDYEGRDGKSRYVAGSIGPGTKLPSLGHIRFTDLRDGYEEQASALLEGGVDLFLIETCMDLLQVKAAMIACRRAMKAAGRQVPLQVQVTMETTGRMLVGSEIGAALTVLTAMKPDVLGINCATGPAEMQEHLRYLSHNSTIPISVLPNAGLPSIVDGRTHYDLSPPELATFHRHHVEDLGIGIVGGCCGTTPEHMRLVVEAVADLEPARRTPTFEPSVSSIYSPVTMAQDLSFLIIGERTNANGSKAFREAMLAADWDTCSKIATEQIREGAHVLDVCVDYVGRDGSADMDEIVSRFATQASVPLVLDSTEPPVLETALQHIGGRAILNSANLEDGELPGSRLDRVFSLAREYGAAVICLLIDERGQARDVEWKLEIAHRIHQIASERYGLTASDLIFDALTFPLSTGDDDLRGDAMNTIEAIRRIKAEIPGTFTTLGVSNVSFGLNPAARHVLNSVFLHECTQAGLDSAIVHAAKIVPLAKIPDEQRDVCLDLIYDRRRPDYDPLQVLLEVFADVKSIKTVKEDRTGWPVGDRLKHRIIDGDREGLTNDLEQALGEGTKALDIVNDVLLDGMRVVGELFGSGQMQLPFVLQSAETMKAAVAFLEPHMDKLDGDTSKGRLVIGTVKGDVHDIGKNLVDIICTNNGYDVHNLGIKVSIGDMVAKVKEVGADALGMSGLLVKSTLDHAGQPRGAEQPRPGRRRAGAARGRRAHAHVRREGPTGDLPGSPFLRPGRVRGTAHARPTHADETQQRVGSRVREGAGWPQPAAAPLAAPGRRVDRDPPPIARRRGRQPRVHAAVPRLADREGSIARRDRRLRERDGAVPQPVAVPAGERRERRRVQGPHPPDPARAARRGQGQWRARAAGRVRVLPRQRRWRRPRGLDGRHAHGRVLPVPLPPPAGRAVPVHCRLLPAARER